MREFGRFGKIKTARIVHDLNGKPRGYAFIEFEDEKNMKEAYMKADGMDIEGRHIVVDVERARTVPNWKPRRFGGNHGSTRVGGPDVNVTRKGRHRDGEINTPAPRDDRRYDSRGGNRGVGGGGGGSGGRDYRDSRERRDYRDRDFRERDRYGGDRDYRGGRDNRDGRDSRGGRDYRGDRDRNDRNDRDRGDRDRDRYRERDRHGDRDRRSRHDGYRPY